LTAKLKIRRGTYLTAILGVHLFKGRKSVKWKTKKSEKIREEIRTTNHKKSGQLSDFPVLIFPGDQTAGYLLQWQW
jgi:hypothetical protein